jgi:hypothetical protein
MAKPKVSDEVRFLCFARAGYRCERCGKSGTAFGFSLHHRRPRMMGGTLRLHIHQPAWLIVLCGSGVDGCHGWVESNRDQARDDGYLLFAIDNGEEIPFKDIEGRYWYLDNLGQKSTSKVGL